MQPYERFDAWKICHALALEVYKVTARYPDSERYGLSSQARRAAYSSAANIAEGSAKRGRKEFRRYLDISLGSLSELSYVLLISRDLGILASDSYEELENLRNRAGQLTWKLYRSMGNRR